MLNPPSPSLSSTLVLPSTQNVTAAVSQPNMAQVEPLQLSSDQSPESVTPPTKVPITLLLVSGRRRTVDFEPDTTIAKLKEQAWNTWPADWVDERPPSPAFLRILYLGRILADDTTFSSLNLLPSTEPTVFHISVRSFAPAGDDDDLSKKKRGRRIRISPSAPAASDGIPDDGRSGGCCGCVIM
ncbi:hypothetical protein FRC03_005965 [Tulasnella sp. 419]|nr:hypothetical protein FRC03_005965 [Tulasnella sp. 419]